MAKQSFLCHRSNVSVLLALDVFLKYNLILCGTSEVFAFLKIESLLNNLLASLANGTTSICYIRSSKSVYHCFSVSGRLFGGITRHRFP